MKYPFVLFGRKLQSEVVNSSGSLEVGNEVAMVVAKGVFTTVGGDVTEVVSVPVLKSGDHIMISVSTSGATPVIIEGWAMDLTNKEVDVTMSADPSDDHVLSYVVYRDMPLYTE